MNSQHISFVLLFATPGKSVSKKSALYMGRPWDRVKDAGSVQDTGFAHVLILEFGLEIASRIQRPAKIGEKLRLECTLADLAMSELVFAETKEDDSEEELLLLQMSASDSSLESSVTALEDCAGSK